MRHEVCAVSRDGNEGGCDASACLLLHRVSVRYGAAVHLLRTLTL